MSYRLVKKVTPNENDAANLTVFVLLYIDVYTGTVMSQNEYINSYQKRGKRSMPVQSPLESNIIIKHLLTQVLRTSSNVRNMGLL